MKQHQFETAHEARWQSFEHMLAAKPARGKSPPADLRAYAAEYRRVCQDFALAQRRGYSPALLARLQVLMQQGHHRLYRPPKPQMMRAVNFFAAEYPWLVRRNKQFHFASAALFFGPFIACMLILQWQPEWVHSLLDSEMIAQMEDMYDPSAERWGEARDAESDLEMFGVYIMNNISIGFRCFASGLLGAIGPVFVLLFNGVILGSVAGHLTAIGHGDPFWRFFSGHSGPELMAIVISGAAGLKLGMALIAPGRRTRARALLEDGIEGAKLALGVFMLLVFAAMVEAFWSSTASTPAAIKYTVGIGLWLLILIWLWRGGRSYQPPAADRHAR
ncbi:stage II sporulation protein M [Pseudomarimonas arenosa]|uniref:Stage II sporulation protein M n=1 Tax=Pseudomarimonas arenosa TaxID=2774145 RepID=A0AAW3ZHD2_9GAMM|nr:stage II sporulation protein M [Pseudomarimonas arenosa]MBD8525498.1 stage II sporulation protein M [Pseudomarimonas arenosa]